MLECAVVVGEDGSIGVSDGDILGEGKRSGGVGDKGGELDSVDGNLYFSPVNIIAVELHGRI